MKKETIEKILKEESYSFTLREIWDMMNEELEKDPSEMDTDLVDLCINVLEKEFRKEEINEKEKVREIKEVKSKKRYSVKKIFIAAAIAAVIMTIALTASGKYMDNSFSDRVVRFYSNYLSIDLRADEDNTEDYPLSGEAVVEYLKDNDFKNVVLSDTMMNYRYSKVSDVRDSESVQLVIFNFVDTDTNISGTVNFEKISERDFSYNGKKDFFDKCDRLEKVHISGLDVLIIKNESYIYIMYYKENIEFTMTITKCDFDDAIKIAKTLN